jgi:hypothetical protein
MIARKAVLSMAAICCSAAVLLPAAAQGAATPAWSLTVTPIPSNFAPGATPEPQYLLSATNVGGAPTTSDPVVLKAVLPAGLTPTGFDVIDTDPSVLAEPECKIAGQEVSCKTTEALHQGRLLLLTVDVAVSAPEGTYESEAAVSGGGSTEVITNSPVQVQAAPLSFGFLAGFQAPTTDEEGAAATLAGSHPYQQTVAFGFPTVNPGDGQTNDGHPRDFSVELPRGMVGDPAASQVLCTEAELTGSKGCPDASQVGITDVTTLVGSVGTNGISTTPLYNMVPPPGTVAELATNVAEVGIYAHILAGVRSDSDYGVEAKTPDVLALGTQPIFSIQAQIWGDPSAEAHDRVRGKCVTANEPCQVTPQEIAFLTMPGDCPGKPLSFEVNADTWEEPSPPFEVHRAFYESADLAGNPVSVNGCGDEEIAFKPTIGAHPTTNVTDSPAGLDFTLHQPQNMKLDSRSPSPLRDAAIRFPAGMTVNPAQASGLGACSEAQIGFEEETDEGRLDFSKLPQSCPDSAKIGTLEATTPALVARNEEHEVAKDIEGNPVLEALHGSVYVAKPFANPFKSLIAVYLVVEDEKTGIVAKLAGEGELDPHTGQITTYFKENPEMPLEDIAVHLFGGSRGALITPPACATYTTKSDLVPWSAPEGEEAFPESSFQTTSAPGGRPCPATEAQMPSAFKLSAGTENPTAGKYSPLLFKLSREDGTQRLSKIESTLPRGLIARLAGVGTCSEADIAKARSREAPEKGALEQADPSCPASSQVGTVIGAAGAGPNPYYTSGHAYLAGPYKGAPISIVAIVPAVAGPFDLGTVVSRIAVFLDPVTAEVRAVSDPLPTVLDGVPLDLRSVALRADRPNFSLNPTSCAEKSFSGQAITTLSQAVPLAERFQVGGCKSLPYKPKMSVRLFGPTHRGAHPRLKAVLTAKAGEANTAAVSFTFPRSEFIDQAHFRTICTRVQFAANQCPAGSVYGHVKVISPLVDYPLEGPAYLRSSSHELPDLVIALHGPPSQPIEIDAAGRVDSVNGGLRVRFQEVPDAPLTKLTFSAQGAKKGLFQNSTNICQGIHRATLKLDAQSGKVSDSQPKLVAQCPKGGSKGKKAKRGGGR